MTARTRSVALVTVQLLTIAYLLVTGPWIVKHLGWMWLEIAGLVLAIWSVATMRIRHLRCMPEVASTARLVTTGPYRYIRHPMYLSVVLTTLSLVIHHFTVWRLVVWIVLVGVLVAKLEYEESLLLTRFSDYRAYRERTKRLIPFLY